MKKMMIVAAAAFAFCGIAHAVQPSKLEELAKEEAPHYHEVTTAELKSWIDGKKKLIILDARTKEYDDGNRIPGALFFPYNASNDEIKAKLPAKDADIVIYCTSTACPASKYLADKLVSMGYTHIYKYPEGIQAWMKAGYPVDKKK